MTRTAATSPERSPPAGTASSPACAMRCCAATAIPCCSSRAISASTSSAIRRGSPRRTARSSYAGIRGAAGPASTQQVNKFTDAILYEMRRHGVAGQKLGCDFIDINMINVFKEKKINWADGMTPMMEARAVKNVDEQECMRIVGAIGDATHWECMKFLKPGLTENQVTAHLMKSLYRIP